MASPAFANLLYKSYVVKHDGDREILCDPYIVQKNDHVLKLFRQRGQISEEDFPEFLRIFRRLNSHIRNIDLIRPGEQIFIPLKRLKPQDGLPGQSSGMVTLPLVTIDPAETVTAGSAAPKDASIKLLGVQDGFLHEGQYFFPRRGAEDLKLDLSRIPVLTLPDGTRMLFTPDGPLPEPRLRVIRSFWKKIQVVSVSRETPLDEVVRSVMETVEIHPSGNRLSFIDRGISVAVGAGWIVKRPEPYGGYPTYVCITLVDDASRCTPETVVGYLEKRGVTIKDIPKKTHLQGDQPQRKSAGSGMQAAERIRWGDLRGFIRELLEAAGCRYMPNVPVTFPYAGIQITATSNRVSVPGRGEFLVDFGDLYGDAVSAIEDSGMEIVQLKQEEGYYRITEKLFNLLGLEYVSDPTFLAADRPAEFNTSLTFSGFLISRSENMKTLFAFSPLGGELVRFLTGRGIRPVVVESESIPDRLRRRKPVP
jgi:hypothetical protein